MLDKLEKSSNNPLVNDYMSKLDDLASDLENNLHIVGEDVSLVDQI